MTFQDHMNKIYDSGNPTLISTISPTLYAFRYVERWITPKMRKKCQLILGQLSMRFDAWLILKIQQQGHNNSKKHFVLTLCQQYQCNQIPHKRHDITGKTILNDIISKKMIFSLCYVGGLMLRY